MCRLPAAVICVLSSALVVAYQNLALIGIEEYDLENALRIPR